MTSRAARDWLASGLMDVEFYGALRGRSFENALAAVEDFVEVGMGRRLSPHPFLDFASQPAEIRRAWRNGKVSAVLAHLTGDDGRIRPAGPLADVEEPASARAELVALAHRLGRNAAGETIDPVDWVAGEKELRADLTSIVVVAAEPRRTVRTVERLLERRGDRDLEVVVVDCGSPVHAALGLWASLHGRPGVELLRLPSTASFVTAMNVGVARARGRVVVLMDAQVTVRRGWLPPLLEALGQPDVAGAQPVVLRADDTIESAGLVVAAEGDPPTRLLAGHPKEDARRLAGESLAAIDLPVMALRTDDVVALQGLRGHASWGESALDLCARLLERRPGGFRVASTALVTVAQQPDASEVAALPPHPLLPPDPGLYRRIGFGTEEREPREAGRMRWSLKLPSAPGAQGDLWGDTHFADALATALRDLGQDVVTCRRGAHTSGPTHLDDVSLALRGLYPIPPIPGQVNVLWVISHPDDVDPEELEGYDVVCAASVSWSAELTARTGREVVPLLQATEFEVPTSASAGERDPRVVFIGNASAGRDRPLVWMAVDSGVPLAVYGRGWEGLPDGVWLGEYVDNSRLPEIYHRHGIVLADHWADMAQHGFIANRVFDAVASGARVICDDVVGIHDVFDPHDVVVVRTPGEIVAAVEELSRPAQDEGWTRPALTFHDRARTLLDLLPPR